MEAAGGSNDSLGDSSLTNRTGVFEEVQPVLYSPSTSTEDSPSSLTQRSSSEVKNELQGVQSLPSLHVQRCSSSSEPPSGGISPTNGLRKRLSPHKIHAPPVTSFSSPGASPASTKRKHYPHYRSVHASRLDHFVKESPIAQSQFWGFSNLAFVGAVSYIVTNPLLRYLKEGTYFDVTLAQAMFEDTFVLMLMWAKCFFWAFSSYFLHVAFRKGYISTTAVHCVQHSTQASLIFFCIASCLHRKWPVIPSSFVLIVSSIFFMKMHSFTETCLELNELHGTADGSPLYPGCINIRNFAHYLLCPVLVYEPQYPKGQGFRVLYFLQKLICLFGAMVLVYVVLTSHVIPISLQCGQITFVEAVLRLMIPLTVIDMLTFYILFEGVCNLFAEISNFGDRDFYQDWWNSTTWDEYARKWNRPVHEFLLRHVYLESLHKFHLSKRDASIATFIFSACMHEMILAVCLRMVRMYMFLMMMLQIPLIAIGNYHRKTMVGNWIFWVGIFLGVPMLVVFYARQWCALHPESTFNLPII